MPLVYIAKQRMIAWNMYLAKNGGLHSPRSIHSYGGHARLDQQGHLSLCWSTVFYPTSHWCAIQTVLVASWNRGVHERAYMYVSPVDRLWRVRISDGVWNLLPDWDIHVLGPTTMLMLASSCIYLNGFDSLVTASTIPLNLGQNAHVRKC